MTTLKEALKAKINSEQQLRTVLEVHGYGDHPGYVEIDGKSFKRQWWAYREELRHQHNVYTVTPPLAALNNILPIFAHVSIEDPTRVAYTPDKNMGEQDRQLVIGLGKLLTRYYPAVQDQVIADFVATHYADLSDEVEWIEPADIAKVYEAGSLGACMSKTSEQFKGYSPTEAYNAPGIRMAVLRNADGEISARCLVYDASETDKRFIRIYGDRLLEKRLKRQGYVPGTWHGVKFKTVKVPQDISGNDHDNTYAMPYLDGGGSMGSELKSTVAMIDGVIQSVTMDYANKLRRVASTCVSLSMSTAGRVILENVDSAQFSVVDCLTGQMVSKFDALTTLRIGGVDYFTKESIPDNFEVAYTMVDGHKVRRNLPTGECVMTHNYDYYDKKYEKEFDLVYLDTTLYPEYTRPLKSDYTRITVDGKCIKHQDALEITSDDGKVYIHVSELVKTGKNRHIRLLEGQYAMPGTKLYLTPSGRKIHPLVHNVVQLHDGMYEFRRNATSVTVLGECVWIPKELPTDCGVGSKLYKKIEAHVLVKYREECASPVMGLSRAISRFYSRISGGNSYRGYGYSSYNLDNEKPVSRQMSLIRRIGEDRQDKPAKLALYAAEVSYAEMNAVEAPHYLTPPSTAFVLVNHDEVAVSSEQTEALIASGITPVAPALDALAATMQEVAAYVSASGVFTTTSSAGWGTLSTTNLGTQFVNVDYGTVTGTNRSIA